MLGELSGSSGFMDHARARSMSRVKRQLAVSEVDMVHPASLSKAPAEAVRARVKDVANNAHTR